MIAITAEQIESCLDYERFKHAKWTPIPVKGNYPRLAIGTVGLAGREAGSWIATHATDAFNPPWASGVVAYPKFPFPRQASEAAAIEAEIEVVVERCEREMRRPGSKVDLRTLQRAIAAVKTFGGRLSFEKYAAETAAQKNRSIPKMSTLMNAKYPAKKAKPKAKAKPGSKNQTGICGRCNWPADGGGSNGGYSTRKIEVPIPKDTKIRLTINVAGNVGANKSFCAEYSLYGPDFGHSNPINENSIKYSNRSDAVADAMARATVQLNRQDLIGGLSAAKLLAIKKAIVAIGDFARKFRDDAADAEQSSAVQVIAPAAGPLSNDEAKKLEMCETVIERNLHSFVDVGSALATIQIGRLYRETHGNFEAYCQEKFEIGRQHAYRLIEATNVVKDLSPNGDSDEQFLPQTESQARALARIKEPQKRKEVWEDIVASHPKFTAKVIEETVAQVLGNAKAEGGRGKAEVRKAARAKTPGNDSLDDDLAEIRKTVQAVADSWTTKYQRQQICDLLRRLAKELTVK